MLSAPEGVACLQTTAGFTQREDTQQRDQTFTSEYLCSWPALISRPFFFRGFRGGEGRRVGGLALGDLCTLICVPACVSVHRHALIFTHVESAGNGRIRKGNESSLKWKVANVAKCKEVHQGSEKIRETDTPPHPTLLPTRPLFPPDPIWGKKNILLLSFEAQW